MSQLPDYRMKFPPTEINFYATVGTTGQSHDSYPAPNTQPRYDWMRMVIIALLGHQASYCEPTEYSEGTLWFDLNSRGFKVRYPTTANDSEWRAMADATLLSTGTGLISLTDFYNLYLGHSHDITGGVVAAAGGIPASGTGILVTYNSTTNQYIISAVPSQIAHQQLSGAGTYSHALVDAHINNTSNPHSVSATQVGNITAQWNANKLMGYLVSSAAPPNNAVLTFSGITWTPALITAGNITDGSITAAKLSGAVSALLLPSVGVVNNNSILAVSGGSWSIRSAAFRTMDVTSAPTPAVSGDEKIGMSASASVIIVNLTGGIDGQKIIILALSDNITIADNADIHLAGGANYVMTNSDTLTLVYRIGYGWVELCRSVN